MNGMDRVTKDSHRPDNSLVTCIDLGKSFAERAVLRHATFSVVEGSILALAGPNGAGKTTLLKILATLIIPSEGTAQICGKDIARDPIRVKRLIGFVSSEERSFYWRLTGRQNLRFFACLHGMSRESEPRIDMLLEAVGLKGKGDLRFREYSTGMKQALGIARGLLHDPPVLLLDEPTRSLGPPVARKVRGLLHGLAKEAGKAILIASQNLNELEDLADQFALLHQGNIRALGNRSALQQRAGLPPSATLEAIFDHFTSEDETDENPVGVSLARPAE
jgi:ABC-2 type transport system ATP-binding protein